MRSDNIKTVKILIIVSFILQANFIKSKDDFDEINFIDSNDSRVKYTLINDDQIMSNLKPVLRKGEIKFLDEYNYNKALEIAERLNKQEYVKKKKYKATSTYECFGNKNNFNSLSEKQEYFKQSKCLPVMMLPGVMGTRLKVLIDCEKIDKGISKQCYNTCDTYYNKKTNRYSTNIMWISLMSGIGKILHSQDNQCLGMLMQNNITDILRDYKQLSNVNGVLGLWHDLGNSQAGQCGKRAIQRLNGDESYNLMDWLEPDLKGYYNMMDMLETQMGYENGINYFGIPYDWRQTEGATDLMTTFKRTVEWSYMLNGKKILIVCHSLGGIQSNFILNQLDQAFKDKYVERLVTIATPFNGAPQLNILSMAVKRSYIIGLWNYGISVSDCRYMFNTNPSFQTLLQITNDQDQEWYKRLQLRLQVEDIYRRIILNQNVTYQEYDLYDQYRQYSDKDNQFQYIPFMWDPQFLFANYHDIGLRIRDQVKDPLITMKNDKKYFATLESTRQFLYDQMLRLDRVESYEVTKSRIDKLLKITEDNNKIRDLHPNVPLTVIFSSQLETVDGYQSQNNVDPIDITSQKDVFYETGKDIFGKGDGSVNTFGALIRPLKWAEMFRQGKSKFGVEFIEYGFLGDLYDIQRPYQPNYAQNSYKGIQGFSRLSHSQLIGDPQIIQFIQSIILAGSSLQQSENSIYSYNNDKNPFDSLSLQESDTILKKIKLLCVNFYADNSITNADQLFQFLKDNIDKDYLLLPREYQFYQQ